MEPRQNLLFIAIDTCRFDHLSCYGYRKKTSPNIDSRLAARGTVFRNHFAPSNCTLPGYTTMFTGLHPISHDIVAHNPQWPINPGIETLGQYLKFQRYYTAQVSTLITMPSQVEHLKWGFDEWEFDTPELKAKYDHFVSEGEQYQGGHVVPAARISAQALDILDHAGKKYTKDSTPFYLFVHFWDPHFTYSPPPEFDKFYDKSAREKSDPANHYMDQFYGCPTGRWVINAAKRDPRYKGVTDPDYIISLYDGQIAYADHHVGLLLDRLEDLYLTDNTVVLLTSDHGETLAEPNNYIMGTKCMFSHIGLTDPNIRIPLLISGPGIPHTTIDDFTQHVDLMPTLMDILGFAGTPGEPEFHPTKVISYAFDGADLFPRMLGKKSFVPAFACELAAAPGDPNWPQNTTPRKAVLILENTYQKFRGLRTKRWKFIKKVTPQPELRSMPDYQLYDLLKDPHEYENIADLAPQICQTLDVLLEGWVTGLCKKFNKQDPQLQFPTTLGIWGDQMELKFLNDHADKTLIINESAEE